MSTGENILNLTLDNSATSSASYEYLYENLCAYFLIWYMPLVIVAGTIGTLFCLFFLFCSKLFQTNLLLWLASICIGDFLILLFEGVWILLKVWFRYDIRDINDVACVLHKTASNYFLYWSAYMQFGLSVQRAYFVFQPLRPRGRSSLSWRHVLVWITISIFLFIPMIPYPMYWRVINDDCDPLDTKIFYIITINDLLIWGILPLLGMTIATIVICWSMSMVGRKFSNHIPRKQKLSHQSSGSYPSNISMPERVRRGTHTERPFIRRWQNASVTAVHRSSHLEVPSAKLPDEPVQSVHGLQKNLRLQPSSDATSFGSRLDIRSDEVQRHNGGDNTGQVTRLLICMNICYLSSTFPLLSFLMFRNFSGVVVPPEIHRFAYYLCRSLCFLNACTNWIFYCLVGKRFRSQAKRLILICINPFCRSGFRGQKEPQQKRTWPSQTFLVPTQPTVIGTNEAHQRRQSLYYLTMQKVVSGIPHR